MKRLFFSSFWMALACAVSLAVIALGVFGDQGLLEVVHLKRETQLVAQRTRDLSLSNQRLKQRVWRLRHDPAQAERLARDQLGFVRDREVVFRFAP